MKNAFLTIAVMTLVATAVTGATSSEGSPDGLTLNGLRLRLRPFVRKRRRCGIRQDSLERARKAEADWLAAADSVRLANHRYRFCVILGSFSSERECRAVCRGNSGEGV